MGVFLTVMLTAAALAALLTWMAASLIPELPVPEVGLTKKQKRRKAKRARRAAKRRMRLTGQMA